MQIYMRASNFPFGKDHGYKLCYFLCLLMIAQLEWVGVFSRGLAVRGFYDYSFHFRICYRLMFQDQIKEVCQTASGVKGSSLPLNISVTLPLKVKRNVLITFIRVVLLLMVLSPSVFQKALSSQDLTFHRVSLTNYIYICVCVCFRSLTIYFKLLGVIKFPFRCWVKMDRHTGPTFSNAHW